MKIFKKIFGLTILTLTTKNFIFCQNTTEKANQAYGATTAQNQLPPTPNQAALQQAQPTAATTTKQVQPEVEAANPETTATDEPVGQAAAQEDVDETEAPEVAEEPAEATADEEQAETTEPTAEPTPDETITPVPEQPAQAIQAEQTAVEQPDMQEEQDQDDIAVEETDIKQGLTIDLPPGVERVCIEAKKVFSVTKETQNGEEPIIEEIEVKGATEVVKEPHGYIEEASAEDIEDMSLNL